MSSPEGSESLFRDKTMLENRLLVAGDLVQSGRYNSTFWDLMLVGEWMEFPLHKYVVCRQSQFLWEACMGKTGTVTIDLVEHCIINETFGGLKAIVDFLYTTDYTVTLVTPPEYREVDQHCLLLPIHPEDFHMGLYDLAARFNIPVMKDLILHKFKCLLYSKEFDLRRVPCVLEMLYTLHPRSDDRMREIILQFVSDNVPALKAIDSIVLTQFYLDRNPRFKNDLLRAKLN
ncbi:hypothetical protein N7540_003385 [Penicillium herquei]|nr:hypothetical protein N7540_003385 [Penicillium herquei]